MKMHHWMFLAGLLSAAVLAPAFQPALFAQSPPAVQENPPVIPAGDVPAPPTGKTDGKADAKKTETKKKSAATTTKPKAPATKSAAAEKPRSTRLSPGPAVATQKNVNLRGQAAINSEIVTRIAKGDLVTVLEEITIKSPKQDEPGRWAKVSLPAGCVSWVSAHFIDPSSKAVLPKRLNLRSGPGENYSILGRVEKGYVVKEVETKGEWMKIEAPTNSYAFIAAHLLSTDPADLGPALAKAHPPAPPVTPPPPPPPPTEVAVVKPTETPAPADPIAKPPPGETPPVVAPPPPPATTNTTETSTPPAEAVEEPPAKRIVTREGIVKGSASIQAPTYFVLRNLENNRTINYLHVPATNIVMREYQLQRVIVTGEEILDERWPNTPVIIVDTVDVVP